MRKAVAPLLRGQLRSSMSTLLCCYRKDFTVQAAVDDSELCVTQMYCSRVLFDSLASNSIFEATKNKSDKDRRKEAEWTRSLAHP
jgi:hypothetical protein